MFNVMDTDHSHRNSQWKVQCDGHRSKSLESPSHWTFQGLGTVSIILNFPRTRNGVHHIRHSVSIALDFSIGSNDVHHLEHSKD